MSGWGLGTRLIATACELTRALLVMYYTPILYCVYALVGRAISIRDPYHRWYIRGLETGLINTFRADSPVSPRCTVDNYSHCCF